MDPNPTSQILTAALTLTPVEAEHGDEAYLATTQDCPWPKAYGGDLVAQAAVAAIRSAGEDRTLHSMHSYFMRPAEIGGEVRYEVEKLRDGRGFSTRQIRAYSGGKLAYIALASFHTGERSGEHQAPMPEGLPDPESLPSSAEYLEPEQPGTDACGDMTKESKAYWSYGRSFDMRHVPGPVYLTVEGGAVPHQAIWVKPFDTLRPVPGLTDAQRDLAALAYVCDYTILEPVLRLLDLPWATPGLVTASLDHAMWFHKPALMDGWLLYAQEVGAAGAGRGLGVGRFFTRDGRHLATVAQEGIIRPRSA
ncbi:acyl-CoA thioesterase-2 [Streptosporangium becharense]|uniref:Acyl-CoA thioesterase-2 n=1 Tax=Streptosporangium becharense TaxID=1816182 RepID=A0A7W9IA83_9ACTN|nr:acyl-CoA thioesterase domain-containing protein [Streptosporangium becharense]MBB2915312.1 acyl-CoA thioesterase-2 [Streptosporangium becharense]MBB5816990.1 acyl-CoA thioesterase-2 [Streptosporangium becharense]